MVYPATQAIQELPGIVELAASQDHLDGQVQAATAALEYLVTPVVLDLAVSEYLVSLVIAVSQDNLVIAVLVDTLAILVSQV